MSRQPRPGRTVAVLYAVALLVTLRLPGAAQGRFGPADIPVVLAVGAFVVWLERARHRKAEAKRDSDREERVSVRR